MDCGWVDTVWARSQGWDAWSAARGWDETCARELGWVAPLALVGGEDQLGGMSKGQGREYLTGNALGVPDRAVMMLGFAHI